MRSRFQRLTCGLATGLLLLGGCEVELYHDLSERHANEALLALRQAGLQADKRPSGRSALRGTTYTLLGSRREEERALALLSEQGLPAAEPRQSGGGKLALLPSEARAVQLGEREQALVETLESLPQVSHARVHLVQAEPDPLLPTAQLRPTAAILLRLRGPLPLKPSEVAELVARSVVGLDAADVTVLSTQAPSPPLAVPPPPGSQRLLLPILGALSGLLSGLTLLLAGLLWRSRRRDEKPKKTEHALHALTSS
jgi:type III secretory pathway lipoprotein EscJ